MKMHLFHIRTRSTLTGETYGGAMSSQTLDPVQDPHIESHIKRFLKKLNSGTGKPLEQLSPKEARAVLTDIQSSLEVDLSGVTVTKKTIVQDGQSIMITIVNPTFTKGILPGFMFFHGGGWVLGDFPTHERLVRDLVFESNTIAIFVNYTPSPEVQYPVAINQAYAATKWVAEHGNEIGVDGKRLALVGNSVGGNMAAVVALMCKEKNGPPIRLQVLLWPVTDSDFNAPSYNLYSEGRFLTKSLMSWFWDNYLPNVQARKEIYASPLQATTEQLKGVAPALILTAENDVLRDEGEAYARKLDEAGVEITATRYNGMIHDWGLLNPLSEVPETRSSLLQVAVELNKALS